MNGGVVVIWCFPGFPLLRSVSTNNSISLPSMSLELTSCDEIIPTGGEFQPILRRLRLFCLLCLFCLSNVPNCALSPADSRSLDARLDQLEKGYVMEAGLPMFEKEFCAKREAGVIGLHCQDRGSSGRRDEEIEDEEESEMRVMEELKVS